MLAPVTRTGAPSTRRPATARFSRGSAEAYGSLLAKSGTGYSSWNAIRPSAETKARSPVLTQDAARAPGSAAAAFPNTAASCARTPGESTVVPGGSRTTTTSGGLSPPEPNVPDDSRVGLVRRLAGQVEGEGEPVAGPGAAARPPARASTTQAATTIHRWASDHRASRATPCTVSEAGPEKDSFDE